MTEKLLKIPDSLLEHELLEVLLYSALPRKDTNPIAHRLLRSFGNIQNVFSASQEQLLSIKGVGKKVASHIYLTGRLCKKILECEKTEEIENFYSFAKYKNKIIEYFNGLEVEQFLIILLNKKYRAITKLRFVDHKRSEVTASIPEIAQAFAINKPTYAIIAHNHLSNVLIPSKEDDFATGKLNILCSVHGVTLLDHVIVGKTDAISYFMENRLDDIKAKYNANLLLNMEDNLWKE